MKTCDYHQHCDFPHMLHSLSNLSLDQLEELRKKVDELRTRARSFIAIETRRERFFCPHCGDADVVKNGHARGLQRYACRACSKTFSNASDSALSGLRRKDRFIEFGRCMAAGMTVRQTAKEMGIAVSTAFRWRHRFLDGAVHHQARNLSGLVEADETFLRESCKGSRSLGRPARKRGGAAMKNAAKNKKAAKKVVVLVMKARGSPHVSDRVLDVFGKQEAFDAARTTLASDALLCTDGSGVYKQVRDDLGIQVESMPTAYAGRTRKGPGGVVYHIQGVNNYHERLKTWLNNRMRGVATKNLPNYLAWMRMREWFKDDLEPEDFIAAGLGHQHINT